jgi:hypothetical protein
MMSIARPCKKPLVRRNGATAAGLKIYARGWHSLPILPPLFPRDRIDRPRRQKGNRLSVVYKLKGYNFQTVNDLSILLGSSSFTAAGRERSFYPKGLRSADYLSLANCYFAHDS